ncbi:HNH endonuclease [Shewanella baltica]|uniref:HNH endonuclease n=1 Tax=Shewanella baltica TaxID=62322 RepID=UPI0035C71AD3|nr:HNH endonuclease [Shewanella baltica]MCS6256139.1 HNH endonuclease [Shewanella baltica]
MCIRTIQCEHCEKTAPFFRTKGGTPYLEVLHQILLSNGGEDTVKNAIALCQNCHRKLHFGESSV